MSDREPRSTGDEGPVAPPIPSFASLRAPQRSSALDLFVPPPEQRAEPAPESAVVDQDPPAPERPSDSGAPRPAEWGDLLHLGRRLGTVVARLVTGGPTRVLAGLRAVLRG